MAILSRSKNKIAQDIKGALGKVITIKQYPHQTVMTAYPDMSKVKSSGKQKTGQSRFQQAVAYGRMVIADPAKKAAYEKILPKGRKIYNAAVSDFLRGNTNVEINDRPITRKRTKKEQNLFRNLEYTLNSCMNETIHEIFSEQIQGLSAARRQQLAKIVSDHAGQVVAEMNNVI
jgi:hypothetical protein